MIFEYYSSNFPHHKGRFRDPSLIFRQTQNIIPRFYNCWLYHQYPSKVYNILYPLDQLSIKFYIPLMSMNMTTDASSSYWCLAGMGMGVAGIIINDHDGSFSHSLHLTPVSHCSRLKNPTFLGSDGGPGGLLVVPHIGCVRRLGLGDTKTRVRPMVTTRDMT